AAGELLSADLALALGRAATHRVAAIRAASSHSSNGSGSSPAAGTPGARGARPEVLIIRDTRESGEMLQAALAAGVSSAGGDALLGGVLPTPAAPLLIARYGFDLAAVISASHNPYEDNGIKFFGADGFKLSDEDELEIEHELEQMGVIGTAERNGLARSAAVRARAENDARRGSDGALPWAIGAVRELRGTQEDYLRELHTRFADLSLDGLDVLLDCANGATYRVAPEIFKRLGASVTVVADSPDGRNINEACGSTHVAALGARVRAGAHALGF